jgi:hypothetical protein
MRPVRWIAALALVAFATAPVVASADDMSDADMREQMQVMQQRMKRMEDKLRDAERRAPAAPAAANDCFFCTIEFEGWISASYMWNTEGFSDHVNGQDLGGFNAGVVPAYPFRPDHNSFSVDQVWMGMERAISADQRAGFRLDFVFGKTADLLNGAGPFPGTEDGFSGSAEDFHMYQAYIQYLAPLGEGVEFKFGKFATLIGAEVVQSPQNYNVTRSNLYNLFQPITHTGIMATASFWEGGTTSLGLSNETRSFPSRDIDLNNNKAILWQVGHQFNDTLFASFNGAFGDADSGAGFDAPSGDKETILDVVVTWDPTDKFSGYFNFDYLKNDAGNTTEGFGFATAGRYSLTEKLGLAGRAEWLQLGADGINDDDMQLFGLTGTLDYLLTQNLMVRGEVRWDQRTGGDIGNLFFESGGATRGVPGGGQEVSKQNQVVIGAEVIYTF